MEVPSPRGEKKLPPRHDPKTRHIDATFPGTVLLNRDPAREYVWAYRSGQDTGLEHYLEMGWRIERQEDPAKNPDCLRLKQGITVAFGNEITWRGSVLVSKPKAEVAVHRKSGVDGIGGLDDFGEMMKQIRREGHVPDDPMFAAIHIAGAGNYVPQEFMGADRPHNEDRETMVRTRS